MGIKNTLQIREAIQQAQETEAEQKHLESFIRLAVGGLHHAISLPEHDRTGALLDFLTNYINRVPDTLDALIESAKRAGAYTEIEKLVTIAVAYFESPPQSVRKDEGMLGLIDEAYLSMRLVEEVNDRIEARYGYPLLPIDLAIPNIVVHSLLGDKFANELDLAVHYALSELFKNAEFKHGDMAAKYLKNMREHDWPNLLGRWPKLASLKESAVALSLDSTSGPVAIH